MLLFATPTLFAKPALRALRFAHMFGVPASQDRSVCNATPASKLACVLHTALTANSNIWIPKLRCRVLAPDIFGAGPLD